MTPPAPPGFNLDGFLASILAQVNGDKDAAIKQLGRENFKIRAKYREIRTKHEELVKALPAKDAVVLAGDDAKAWNEFKGLGLPVADVKKGLEERGTLQAKVVGMEREGSATKAAAVHKWKPGVLLDLINSRQLDLSVQKVQVKDPKDGQTKDEDQWHVRKQGDSKATWTPLTKYAETEMKDYLPALQLSEGSGAEGEGAPRFSPVPGSSPAAPGGKAMTGGDVAQAHISRRYSPPGEQPGQQKAGGSQQQAAS